MQFKGQLSGLVGLFILAQGSLAQTTEYLGYEAHAVSDYYRTHLSSRFFYGKTSPVNSRPTWQLGWEAGINWLADHNDSPIEMHGWGVDGFWVADNQFMPHWHVFTKLGLEFEALTTKYINYYGQLQQNRYSLMPVAKLGIGYEFRNGIGLGMGINYRLSENSKGADGFYGSLMLKYSFTSF